MPTTPRFPRPIAVAFLTAGSAVLLMGCTVDLESTPEPTATATAITFDPEDVAVGELLDEATASWDSVDAWVSETRIETPSSGSGEAASTSESTERVILPGDRYVLTTNGDTIVSEEIAVGGRIYMRGALVTSSIYPDAAPDEWIAFTPDLVPEGTVLEQRVDYLTMPPGYPFRDVSATTRQLPASPSETISIDERECDAWTFSTATSGQEGLDYTIAFDQQNRPCQLIREGGGVTETTTWTYPETPEPIEAPSDAISVQEFPSDPS